MMKKILLRIFWGIGALTLIISAAGFLWLRSSLPTLSGEAQVAVFKETVEIVYDKNGVPHISARSTSDAYRALGYVHASDRLFQMDFMRRLGAGRLSEVVGRPTVPLDKTMRTLGLYRLAQASYDHLSRETQAALDAYAAGVNGYLSTHPGALPPEFIALGYRPEDWKPADSLVWGRLMAMRLSGNWRTEALRAALSHTLSADRIADLWPPETDAPPPTVRARLSNTRFTGMWETLLEETPDFLRQVSASNSWALAGRLSTTGKPLLANDPHLGFRAPGLWYLARINAPGLAVTGATVPGVPFHILGHNRRIAWAFTTTDSDTQDLFIERLTKNREHWYDTPAGSQAFDIRGETIAVKGAPPVAHRVRMSRHGPVISDVTDSLRQSDRKGYVVALASAGLETDDTTAQALHMLNRAGDWQEFRSALTRFHSPQQNVSYADIEGNIGFLAPGRVPVRRKGRGKQPVPGWSGEYDWPGFIPFNELPTTYNPASGRIVNANHRIVSNTYPHYLTDDWAPPYRANRILDILKTGRPATLQGSLSLQNDNVSLAARDLLPLMISLLPPSGGDERNIRARLKEWDGTMDRNKPEPLIFMVWLRETGRKLYGDELGPLFNRYSGLRPRALKHMLSKRQSWCDVVSTDGHETCTHVVSQSFKDALLWLKERHGDVWQDWRWGEAHPAVFSHPMFGRVPFLRPWSDIRIESDGGPFTVNRAQPRYSNQETPFESRHGPGYRAVYDLSDLKNSRFATATGQSGNPLSSRYGNNTEDWRDGIYIKIPQTRDEAVKDAMGILTLRPPK